MGRVFASDSLVSQWDQKTSLRWFPQAQGDDYKASVQFRAGQLFGPAAFDQLYVLGQERDNDLLLRGHAGTINGYKGSAPLGSGYVLMNTEVSRSLFSNGFLRVDAGPFLDLGNVYGPLKGFRDPGWMWDAGIRVDVRLLDAVSVTYTYGRDLRTGRSAHYWMESP
jgi:hypothetical protein